MDETCPKRVKKTAVRTMPLIPLSRPVETAKMKLRISRLSTLIPQKSETTNKI
jgi:hypothetical protein